MSNSLKIIVSVFVTILTILVNIQKSFGQEFLKNLSVRKAFESKTPDDDNPATISFTDPTNKASSFLLNAGVGYKFTEKSIGKIKDKNKLTLNVFFVYNVNSLISIEQHNYKLGITAETRFGMNPQKLVFFGNHTMQYIRDYVDTNYSALLTTYWHILSKGKGPQKFGDIQILINPFLIFSNQKLDWNTST